MTIVFKEQILPQWCHDYDNMNYFLKRNKIGLVLF